MMLDPQQFAQGKFAVIVIVSFISFAEAIAHCFSASVFILLFLIGT